MNFENYTFSENKMFRGNPSIAIWTEAFLNGKIYFPAA